MKKRMEPLTVRTGEDLEDQQFIVIEQSEAGEDQSIWIAPEQVPILTTWLNEAAQELEANKGTGTSKATT